MLHGLNVTRKKLTYLKQILSVLRKRSFRPASNLCLTVTMLQYSSANPLLLHDLAIRHSPKVCRSYYYMILNRGNASTFMPCMCLRSGKVSNASMSRRRKRADLSTLH